MAKKKKQEEEQVVVQPKEKKSYFPKFSIVLGIFLIIIAIVDYFGFYDFPKIVIDISLILAGFLMLKRGFAQGFGAKRKEILKKYI